MFAKNYGATPSTPAKTAKGPSYSKPTWNSKAPEVTVDKQVKPVSPRRERYLKAVNGLFSSKGLKGAAKYLIPATLASAATAAICIFAGPAIHTAVLGAVTSAAFPPVGIAILVTLGVSLLAFIAYKYVHAKKKEYQNGLAAKAKLEQDAEAKKVSAEDKSVEAFSPGPTPPAPPAAEADQAPTFSAVPTPPAPSYAEANQAEAFSPATKPPSAPSAGAEATSLSNIPEVTEEATEAWKN